MDAAGYPAFGVTVAVDPNVEKGCIPVFFRD
jgi:hypothetical protein